MKYYKINFNCEQETSTLIVYANNEEEAKQKLKNIIDGIKINEIKEIQYGNK